MTLQCDFQNYQSFSKQIIGISGDDIMKHLWCSQHAYIK